MVRREAPRLTIHSLSVINQGEIVDPLRFNGSEFQTKAIYENDIHTLKKEIENLRQTEKEKLQKLKEKMEKEKEELEGKNQKKIKNLEEEKVTIIINRI